MAGLAQHKGHTFQNSDQEKQYFKECWICPPLQDKWRLNDRDRNVLETAGRPAGVKGVTLDGQFKGPFSVET